MFKSLTVVSLVASVAVAQSLVPSGISDGCSAFLKELNTDANLSKCTTALSTALTAFAPGASSANADAVAKGLDTLCGDSVASECPTGVFASKITGFYSACSEELTSKSNADVIKIYDVLYVVPAMRTAVCSKDDSGNWCAASATPADGTSADSLQSALYTKNGETIVPNTSTFTKNNIPFLFASTSSSKEALCTTCTRNVLNAYIQHESNLPYAPGLQKSQLLGSQTELFTAVTEKCGDNFMNSEVKAAGGLSAGSNSLLGGSNGASSVAEFKGVFATLAGIASLALLF